MPPRKTGKGSGGGFDWTWENVLSKEVARALQIIWPWLAWVLTLAVGSVVHLAWHHDWVISFCLPAIGALLAVVCFGLTHRRSSLVARLLTPATCLAGFTWLGWISWDGWASSVMAGWFLGGLTVCCVWNAWTAITGREDSAFDGLFATPAAKAGMPGLKLLKFQLHRDGGAVAGGKTAGLAADGAAAITGKAQVIDADGKVRKVSGIVQLRPGEHTADDLSRAVPNIESAAGMPPGSITVTRSEDNASQAHIIISDPRVLRSPIPWRGPSAAGASIAVPLHLGTWQDGEPALVKVTNHHAQVMAMTGGGKSFGYGWAELGETITRRDAAVMAFDITKGGQTLQPLAAALTLPDGSAGFIEGREQAREAFEGIHRAVRARTDALTARHLQNWKENCGLTHLTFLLEEAPDIFLMLDDDDLVERWQSDVKAARSAGARWLMSLQRSDWSQMPTIIRGQLAHVCGGVANAADAQFGLSAYQQDHDAAPELWAQDHPGMFYMDAPGVSASRKVMPMRTWFWGDDTRVMAAHAAAYPASLRPLDEVTLAALAPRTGAATLTVPGGGAPTATPAPPDAEDATAGPAARPARPGHPQLRVVRDAAQPAAKDAAVSNGTDDMTEYDVADDDLDADLPGDGETLEDEDTAVPAPTGALAGFTWEPAEGVTNATPEQARQVFHDRLAEWQQAGVTSFGVAECVEIAESVGRSRQWVYPILDEFEAAQLIRKVGGYPAKWQITGQVAS